MSGRFPIEFLFDLFDLSFEALVQQAGFLAPGFAFRLPLSDIGGYFPTVNILVTLRLALEFGTQFVFRHVVYPSL